MSAERYDAIVVGAGHNGLVCAALLAKAGRNVLVLEARDEVGGGALTREFAEGFRVSGLAHFVYQLAPVVVRELGLDIAMANDAVATVLPVADEIVRLTGDEATGVGDRDARAFQAFVEESLEHARVLQRLFERPPPRLGSGRFSDRLALARLGLSFVRRRERLDLLRLVGQNLYDELDARFEHAGLKAAIAFDGVIGSQAGPRSPGNVINWLYQLGASGGRLGQPKGGAGAIAAALRAAAEAAGATVVCGAPVERIAVENGRVAGVDAGGQRYDAWTVVSNADPKSTVLALVGARHFESPFVRRIQNLRANGNVAKFHCALDGLPDWPTVGRRDLSARWLTATSMDEIELAFNPAKYGECSTRPVIEAHLPSVEDSSLAPAGQHVLSANVLYAPYDRSGGWTEDARAKFSEAIVTALDRILPGIAKRMIATELLTPVDIEAAFGNRGGHWHHTELALDQFLFVRPAAGSARRLPLDGLYLCGAGAHPGGGISGLPGRNAARAIIDRGRR